MTTDPLRPADRFAAFILALLIGGLGAGVMWFLLCASGLWLPYECAIVFALAIGVYGAINPERTIGALNTLWQAIGHMLRLL